MAPTVPARLVLLAAAFATAQARSCDPDAPSGCLDVCAACCGAAAPIKLHDHDNYGYALDYVRNTTPEACDACVSSKCQICSDPAGTCTQACVVSCWSNGDAPCLSACSCDSSVSVWLMVLPYALRLAVALIGMIMLSGGGGESGESLLVQHEAESESRGDEESEESRGSSPWSIVASSLCLLLCHVPQSAVYFAVYVCGNRAGELDALQMQLGAVVCGREALHILQVVLLLATSLCARRNLISASATIVFRGRSLWLGAMYVFTPELVIVWLSSLSEDSSLVEWGESLLCCCWIYWLPFALHWCGIGALGAGLGVGTLDTIPPALAVNYAASALGIIACLLGIYADTVGCVDRDLGSGSHDDDDEPALLEKRSTRVSVFLFAALCCVAPAFFISFALGHSHVEDGLDGSGLDGETTSWWSTTEVFLITLPILGLCALCCECLNSVR